MSRTLQDVLVYDDACSLCVSQMRGLTRLDWRGAIRTLPLSDPLCAEIAPGVGHEQLLAAIHCITTDGHIHRGARAVRYISLRVPALIPLGLVLWIPGMIYVAQYVYAWVARNRHQLGLRFGDENTGASRPADERSAGRTSEG